MSRRRAYPFDIYLNKLLKETGFKMSLRTSAKDEFNKFICCMIKRMINAASIVAQAAGRMTISHAHAQASISILLPKDLRDLAIQAATKAITKHKLPTIEESESKRTRIEKKAGLVFPVSRIADSCQRLLDKKLRMSVACTIYITSVVEYLSVEALVMLSDLLSELSETRARAEHLQQVFREDRSFSIIYPNALWT